MEGEKEDPSLVLVPAVLGSVESRRNRLPATRVHNCRLVFPGMLAIIFRFKIVSLRTLYSSRWLLVAKDREHSDGMAVDGGCKLHIDEIVEHSALG